MHENKNKKMEVKIMNKWTKEQEAYLLIKREEKVRYETISELMEVKFGIKRNANTIAAKYRGLTKGNKKQTRKPIVWNTKKVDFVYSCLWNGLTMDRIKLAFKDEFDYMLSNTQLKNCLAKQKPSGKIQALAEKMLNPEKPTFNPLKEAKQVEEVEEENWRIEPATRKQLRYLASLMNPDTYGKDLSKMAKGMVGNFTKGEACDKIDEYLSINDKIIEAEIAEERPRNIIQLKTNVEEPTPIETFVEKHGNPKTRHLSNDEKEMLLEINEQLKVLDEQIQPIQFTREQDLYLLINWHTMSIDEARDYFGMPYYLLAKRLELVIDSTEPYHIDLLMEAAKAISARKEREDAIKNMGYWKRRKLRKQEKKVAKLEKKLKRMRGE